MGSLVKVKNRKGCGCGVSFPISENKGSNLITKTPSLVNAWQQMPIKSVKMLEHTFKSTKEHSLVINIGIEECFRKEKISSLVRVSNPVLLCRKPTLYHLYHKDSWRRTIWKQYLQHNPCSLLKAYCDLTRKAGTKQLKVLERCTNSGSHGPSLLRQ